MSLPRYYCISAHEDRDLAIQEDILSLGEETWRDHIQEHGIEKAIDDDIEDMLGTDGLFLDEATARAEAAVHGYSVHEVTRLDWERVLARANLTTGSGAVAVNVHTFRLTQPPKRDPVLVFPVDGEDPFVATYEMWDEPVWYSHGFVQQVNPDDKWADISGLRKEAAA